MRGLLLTPGGLGPGLRGDPNPATRGGSSWRSALPCEGGPGGRCPLPAGKLSSSEPWRMELIKIGPRALSPPKMTPVPFFSYDWGGEGVKWPREGAVQSSRVSPLAFQPLNPRLPRGKQPLRYSRVTQSLLRLPGVAPFELSTRHSGPPVLTSKSRPGTASGWAEGDAGS